MDSFYRTLSFVVMFELSLGVLFPVESNVGFLTTNTAQARFISQSNLATSLQVL